MKHPSTFRLLSAAEKGQRAEWLGLWARWPHREVFAHPSYVELFARPEDQVLCAAAEGSNGGILYALILRPVASDSVGAELTDITSPYGYGGPYGWGMDVAEIETFWNDFDDWAREQKVVSLFARLSLFEIDRVPFRGEVSDRNLNVVCDLRPDLDEIWRRHEHKVRKNVKRARASGVSVDALADTPDLADFLTIYSATLDRRRAEGWYYFSESFFASLFRDLRGLATLFNARVGGKVVSTEIILESATTVYSFLGGSLEEGMSVRANDFLKHEVIVWAKRRGKTAFVLGGGYQGEDGIFRYKRSFAPGGLAQFSIGTRIFDRESFDLLVTEHSAKMQEVNPDWWPKENFFPAYRSP